jgi:hypothetical protein
LYFVHRVNNTVYAPAELQFLATQNLKKELYALPLDNGLVNPEMFRHRPAEPFGELVSLKGSVK